MNKLFVGIGSSMFAVMLAMPASAEAERSTPA